MDNSLKSPIAASLRLTVSACLLTIAFLAFPL